MGFYSGTPRPGAPMQRALQARLDHASRTRPRSSRTSTTTRTPCASSSASSSASASTITTSSAVATSSPTSAFNVPIETAWQTLNESQKGLSGVEKHARLSITHYKGKTEVAAVTNEPIPGLKGAENGVVIFKLLRNAARRAGPRQGLHRGTQPRRDLVRRLRGPRALRRGGLFDYARVVVVPT
jgi:hypothetical protein